MDLRQLRYFVALATQQHYGRAASVLHVAQPALSRQMRLLEEELGVKLFERHARGATPTQEALFLLERASFLVGYADQIKQDMTARQREPSGRVSIGLTPGLAMLLAVPLTRAVSQRWPGVRLRIVDGFPPALRAMLLEGGVDVAILNSPLELSKLVSAPLLSEQICLIGRRGDPLMDAAGIALAQLAGLPLVMTGLAKSGVRLELDVAAAHAGVVLTPVVEVATLEVAKRLVLEGVGYTVHFAAPIQGELDAGRLVAVPVQGLYLRRVLARAAERPSSRATEEVIAVINAVVQGLVASGGWPNAALESPQGVAGAVGSVRRAREGGGV